MAAVTVSRAGDRLIAVKQVPAEHARDIEREAESLQRIAHPGVVRFVDLVETPDRGRALHTEFVSSDTWATRPATNPTERAAGVAALAGVVADLHDMGLAHCQIHPSHVLHGDGDRPVLCGFRLASEASPENRRADLVALADLCHDPALEQGPLVDKLSALADAARAGRMDIRELARRLAMIPDKRSTAGEPARTAAGSGHGRTSRPGKMLRVVVTAVLGVSAAVAAAGIWSRGQQESAPVTIADGAAPLATSPGGAHEGVMPGATQAPDSTGSPAATGSDTFVTTLENTIAVADPVTAAGADPATSPDSASAMVGASDHPTTAAASPAAMIPGILGPRIEAEPRLPGGSAGNAMDPTAGGTLLSPASGGTYRGSPTVTAGHEVGTVLEHGGHLYGVGAPGDFVETGDWDCDGEPTPAIVRPSTGDVVLFNAWPAPHRSIVMPVRWEVDDPTGAEAVAHGSCDLLRVYTSAGSKLFDPMEGRREPDPNQ